MKLVICLECGDIFNLTSNFKACTCGKTYGHAYSDQEAEYWGPAQPMAIVNSSFANAIHMQQDEDQSPIIKKEVCKGVHFESYFIPRNSDVIYKMDDFALHQ